MESRSLWFKDNGFKIEYKINQADSPKKVIFSEDRCFCNQCGQRLVSQQTVCPSCHSDVSEEEHLEPIIDKLKDISIQAYEEVCRQDFQKYRMKLRNWAFAIWGITFFLLLLDIIFKM